MELRTSPAEEVKSYSKKAIRFLNQKDYEKATQSFTKAFNVDENKFNKYARFDYALFKLHGYGQLSSDLNIQNIFGRQISTLKKLENYGFIGKEGSTSDPLKHLLVNHNLKLIYCSIPKNACTYFKEALIANNSSWHEEYQEYQKSNFNVHDFLSNKRLGYSLNNLISHLEDETYTKIVILRNPFERIVSAYLNKIITSKRVLRFVEKVINSVSQRNSKTITVDNRITFQQFVEYLCYTKDPWLNIHFRPQHCFVGNIKFDIVGQFENMNSVIDRLEDKFNIQLKRKKPINQTSYQDIERKNKSFHSMYRQELCSLDGLPTAKQLFTPELERMFRKRYALDIEIYERAFNTNLN